jgi:hypothetical protein
MHAGRRRGKNGAAALNPKVRARGLGKKRTKVSNWMKKKSGGGSVRTGSHGCCVVGQAPPDRCRDEPRAQGNGILESTAHAELRLALNGECEQGVSGFAAESFANGGARVLHVPYHVTDSEVTALLLCRNGLLRSKLDGMCAEDAHYVYLTTLTQPEPEN